MEIDFLLFFSVDFPDHVALQRVPPENGLAGVHSAGLDGLHAGRPGAGGTAAAPLGRQAGQQHANAGAQQRSRPRPAEKSRAAPPLGRFASLAQGAGKGKWSINTQKCLRYFIISKIFGFQKIYTPTNYGLNSHIISITNIHNPNIYIIYGIVILVLLYVFYYHVFKLIKLAHKCYLLNFS